MQNRTAIWLFTVLLALACVYQLSFTWVVNNVETDATERAVAKVKQLETDGFVIIGADSIDVSKGKGRETAENYFLKKILLDTSDIAAYPVFGFTYQECKDKQINLGLDLQGGMSVTLEISVPELVKNMAGSPRQPSFTEPYDAALEEYKLDGGNFIEIFSSKFNEMSPEASLAKFFNRFNKDKFPIDATNDAVISELSLAAAGAIDQTEQVINTRINKFGVNQPTIQKQASTGRLYIELPGVKEEKRVRKLLQSTANLEFWETFGVQDFGNSLVEINTYLKGKNGFEVKEAIETITDSTLVAEQTDSTANASDSSSIEDLLADDNVEADTTNQISGNTAVENPWFFYVQKDFQNTYGEDPVIGFTKISDTSIVNSYLRDEKVLQYFPKGLEPMWAAKPRADDNGVVSDYLSLFAIKKTYDGKPRLDGDGISDARQDFDPVTGEVEVLLNFKGGAAVEWANFTEERTGKSIAITMDDLVFTCPNVPGKIEGGNTSISGGFSLTNAGIQEAKDISTVLKAGALPAPAKIVDESIVGPTLGKENIKSGFTSFIIAILLVLIYMVFYYAKAGTVSVVALVANIFFIIGTLASLGAALTLPGIAGIVLTIGMSVDANVLIYERIREELRQGKGLKLALDDGYKRAYSAIIDANITTLLTAIVLAYFGTGPIQGFATTLIIGIFTSLFSAIFITRLIFSYMIDKKQNISFSTKLTANVFVNSKIGFVAKRKMYYIISGIVIIAGVASIATKGLDKGIEFTGGRAYKVEFNNLADGTGVEDVKTSLTNAFEGVAPEVKTVTNSYTFEVKTKYLYNSPDANANDLVDAALTSGLESFGEFVVLDQRQVDASITDDLVFSSILAIIFSLLIIFVYIKIRFNDWQFGLGALLAMGHDVMVVLALFSIFWGIVPFSLEIDQAFIAAILTVVGYSINDTVVVFDRIREYLNFNPKSPREEVINNALNSTLSRTINTSMTTFVVLLIIFLFGGESIKGFSFALMIGVVVGTYSSLCIATPTVVDFSKKLPAKKD